MLKKLRNKLLFVNLASLAVIIAATFSAIYISAYARVENTISEQIQRIPSGVAENVAISQRTASPIISGGGRNIVINGGNNIPVDFTKSFVVNILQTGQASVFSQLDLEENSYLQAIKSALSDGKIQGKTSINGRTYEYLIAQPTNVAATYTQSIVFLDIDNEEGMLARLAASLFIIGFAALGAIFAVSFTLANRAIAPVEASIDRQRRFVADASHELKTPLAIIMTNAEAAAVSTNPAPWLGNIEQETSRMKRLIENLMSLARAEDTEAKKEAFDVNALIQEEADRVEAILFENGVSLEMKLPEGRVQALADKGKLAQTLSVLLDNAVKYTPSGGRVVLEASIKEKAANSRANLAKKIKAKLFAKSTSVADIDTKTKTLTIAVSNTGDLIAKSDLPRIFDRFYRADKSRNSDAGGHGIGLSIAKALVHRLGGKLTVKSEPIFASPFGNSENIFENSTNNMGTDENASSFAPSHASVDGAEFAALNTFTLSVPI